MWDLDNPNHETFKDLVFHPNHPWKEINLSHLQAHISIYPNDRTPVITYDMRGLWYRCFVFSPLFNVIIPKKNLNLFILLINSANLSCNEQANAITSQMACWPFNDLVLKKELAHRKGTDQLCNVQSRRKNTHLWYIKNRQHDVCKSNKTVQK